MTTDNPSRARFEREDVGDERSCGAFSIRPVARVTGFKGSSAASEGHRSQDTAGAVVAVRPVAALVRDEDGNETRLRVTDPTAQALRGILMGGAAVAVAGALTTFAAHGVARLLRARRRPSTEPGQDEGRPT